MGENDLHHEANNFSSFPQVKKWAQTSHETLPNNVW